MNVALFSSCIVDTLRPEIGFAAVRLLESAGCQVSVPAQSCCGQVNYNNGDLKGARKFVRQWLDTFEAYEYVVIPSGSCAAMLIHHAVDLFSDSITRQRVQALADKTHELSCFLVEVAPPKIDAGVPRKVCYHDSCSGLRELGIKHQPRSLLAKLGSIELVELENAEACCGFGGTFCVKHPEISCRLADDKIATVEKSGCNTLVGGDWSCLMHLQARMDAQDKPIEVMHWSELLAQARGRDRAK